MKKITLLLLLVFVIAKTYSQNYLITFAGIGASATVDSVKVENITQCTDTALAGGDILNLTSVITSMNELNNIADKTLHVFPNPMNGFSLINFNATASGNAIIELYDMTGKRILQSKDFLSKGNQSYRLSGIDCGVYIISIKSDEYSYTSKIVSNDEATGTSGITHISAIQGTEKQTVVSKTEKVNNVNIGSTIQMQFNLGDTLKLTGKSGNFRTVIMLFPANSQIVTFTFVNCTDADSNHYAVVQIGTQLWMEENLKTTKYQDGSSIINIPDSATWGSTSAGAYCDYHNDPAEGAKYGHLYNWFAVGDIRNIAPAGWHVASNGEWNIMEKLLDNTVDTNALTGLGGVGMNIGRILKENCNTRWAYLDTTWGINSSGFTALCTNYRTAMGGFSTGALNSHDDGFWTSTTHGTGNAWYKSCRWCYRNLFVIYPMKQGGYSVRCIKD